MGTTYPIFRALSWMSAKQLYRYHVVCVGMASIITSYWPSWPVCNQHTGQCSYWPSCIHTLDNGVLPASITCMTPEDCLVHGGSSPLFRELPSYPVFHECEVVDLSTKQSCGQAAIHDVTQHSVTFGGILPSEQSLAAAWLLWKLRVA